MESADTQHLADYLQGWHWPKIDDSMDILNDFIKVDGGVSTLHKCKPTAADMTRYTGFLRDGFGWLQLDSCSVAHCALLHFFWRFRPQQIRIFRNRVTVIVGCFHISANAQCYKVGPCCTKRTLFSSSKSASSCSDVLSHASSWSLANLRQMSAGGCAPQC